MAVLKILQSVTKFGSMQPIPQQNFVLHCVDQATSRCILCFKFSHQVQQSRNTCRPHYGRQHHQQQQQQQQHRKEEVFKSGRWLRLDVVNWAWLNWGNLTVQVRRANCTSQSTARYSTSPTKALSSTVKVRNYVVTHSVCPSNANHFDHSFGEFRVNFKLLSLTQCLYEIWVQTHLTSTMLLNTKLPFDIRKYKITLFLYKQSILPETWPNLTILIRYLMQANTRIVITIYWTSVQYTAYEVQSSDNATTCKIQ